METIMKELKTVFKHHRKIISACIDIVFTPKKFPLF